MTLTEFAKLVQEMRDAQKKFFEGLKTHSHLVHCQNLEQKVDANLLLIKKRHGSQVAFDFGNDEYEG